MRPSRRLVVPALLLAAAASACSASPAPDGWADEDGAAPPLVENGTSNIGTDDEPAGDDTEVSPGDIDETTAPATAFTPPASVAMSPEAEPGNRDNGGEPPAAEPELYEIEVDDSDLDELIADLDDALAGLLAGMNQSEGDIEE